MYPIPRHSVPNLISLKSLSRILLNTDMKKILFYLPLVFVFLNYSCVKNRGEDYISPEKIEWSPTGDYIAVCDVTGKQVMIYSQEGKLNRIAGRGIPSDIYWINPGQVLVSFIDRSELALYDIHKNEWIRTLAVCPHPSSIAYAGKTGELWVTSRGLDRVYVYDFVSGKEISRIVTGRNPVEIDISHDESLVAISSLLPVRAMADEDVASSLQLIDREKKQLKSDIKLPYGSSNLRNAVFTADGKRVLAVHTRGRVNLPTSQLEKGWVSTNMLSIVDPEKDEVWLSLLLDMLSEGAANPWDIEISPDGTKACIAVAGSHELAVIDLALLDSILEGKHFPDQYMDNFAGAETARNVWQSIQSNPEEKWLLSEKLAALYSAGVLKRIRLPLMNPRGLSMSHDGKKLAISGYFSGNMLILSTDDFSILEDVSLGNQPEPDDIRKGEILFNDATQCFQHWLSCVTCHPDGRADGLNWDLLNDGIGNPKNTKSLLLTHKTPPVMSRGARPDYTLAVTKGFHFIQFYESSEEENAFLRAYLENMKADESPYKTANNEEIIKQGEEIFHSPKTGCSDCHPGPYFTDLNMYDVGSKASPDRFSDFDTPTLVEVWRTGPYMHHGAAGSMMEVLK